MENKKAIEVVINDRGPFINDRVIDLSKAGALKLDFVKKGVTKVKVEVLGLAKNKKSNAPVVAAKPKTSKPKKASQKKSAPVAISKNVTNSVASEGLSYYRVDSESITPKGFGIQIASYQEAANLMQRCNNLKNDSDKEVIIQVGDSKGKKVYRVILGGFSSKESAEKYQSKITGKYKGCFVLGF